MGTRSRQQAHAEGEGEAMLGWMATMRGGVCFPSLCSNDALMFKLRSWGKARTSIGFFFAFMMFGSVAYLGSLRRKSVVTTTGVFIETVSTPPSTSLVMVALPGASSTFWFVRFSHTCDL